MCIFPTRSERKYVNWELTSVNIHLLDWKYGSMSNKSVGKKISERNRQEYTTTDHKERCHSVLSLSLSKS